MQKAVTNEFVAISDVGFKTSAGAIDVILIWIQKSSEKKALHAGAICKNPIMKGRTS